jgi:hypothetical protein
LQELETLSPTAELTSPEGGRDTEENRKWFADRVDSAIQNVVDVKRSDYDDFRAHVEDDDERLRRVRNTIGQAVIVATSIALTQTRILSTTLLLDVIVIFVLLSVVWTIIIGLIERIVAKRVQKVQDANAAARASLLSLQSWFQGDTMNISAMSQKTLDLYFDFVKVAVAAIYKTIFDVTLEYQTGWSRRCRGLAKRPRRALQDKREELTDRVIFSQKLLQMLWPFDKQYPSPN